MIPFQSSAFAPVNIAWIKYMGKEEGKPANSSLSLTLKNTGTTVKLVTGFEVILELFKQPHCSDELQLYWQSSGYIPPEVGQKKIFNFLSNQNLWKEALKPFGYKLKFPKKVLIHTTNNAPAASGVATSASSFAAFTLAWAKLLVSAQENDSKKLEKQFLEDFNLVLALASVAAQGSGSACRSMTGPWVEWDTTIRPILSDNPLATAWGNIIFLIESTPKTVSSSEAHVRVKSSRNWFGRSERAKKRLQRVKNFLETNQISELKSIVWEEAQDMHDLFLTSVPAFRYQTAKSLAVANLILDGVGPTSNAVVTMDAGANVHLFFPLAEQELWEKFARETFSDMAMIVDEQGTGAQFL